MVQIYNSVKARNPFNFETRRVQTNGRSLVTVLPKIFTDQLGIERGDLMKFTIHTTDRNRMVIEKINIDAGRPMQFK